MKTVVLIVCFALAAIPVAADTLKSEKEATKLAEQALAHFAKEEFDQGYRSLLPYWPLPEAEIVTLIDQTQSQWEIVRTRFGKTLGTEIVRTERIGSSFLRLRFIQKFDRHALRWTFAFYKPKDSWVINEVSFDDEIDDLYLVEE